MAQRRSGSEPSSSSSPLPTADSTTPLPTDPSPPLTCDEPNPPSFTVSEELLTLAEFINSKNPPERVRTALGIVLRTHKTPSLQAFAGEVRRAINEIKEAKSAINTAGRQSYAAAARQGAANQPSTNLLNTQYPTLRVPPQALQEVTYRITPSEGTKLSPAQIVQKANSAIGEPAVLAARRLPSGDVVISFESEALKEQFIDNIALRTAIDPSAKPIQRGFPVSSFGFP